MELYLQLFDLNENLDWEHEKTKRILYLKMNELAIFNAKKWTKFSKTFSIEFEQWNGKLSQTIKLFFYQSQFFANQNQIALSFNEVVS